VQNSKVKNSLGQNSSFALVPGETSIPYVAKKSQVRQRAGFIDHHFWATPYTPGEMHAADDYPNQSQSRSGLPAWTAKNRSLVDRDVVVWYSFGLTHIPRPEEWPVMTVTPIGFKLLPVAFFNKNPALDVPLPRK
jgi:primary-amine oxidase